MSLHVDREHALHSPKQLVGLVIAELWKGRLASPKQIIDYIEEDDAFCCENIKTGRKTKVRVRGIFKYNLVSGPTIAFGNCPECGYPLTQDDPYEAHCNNCQWLISI